MRSQISKSHLLILLLLLAMAGCNPEPRESPGNDQESLKRVFITRSEYTGDLKSHGEANDGLAGADSLCSLAAKGADLGGQWRAYLSSSTISAVDRLQDVGPWYTVNRIRRVFNNIENLQTFPLHPLNQDEFGNDVKVVYWTGTPHSSQDNTDCWIL